MQEPISNIQVTRLTLKKKKSHNVILVDVENASDKNSTSILD